jgi:hypothetical protein
MSHILDRLAVAPRDASGKPQNTFSGQLKFETVKLCLLESEHRQFRNRGRNTAGNSTCQLSTTHTTTTTGKLSLRDHVHGHGEANQQPLPKLGENRERRFLTLAEQAMESRQFERDIVYRQITEVETSTNGGRVSKVSSK